MTLNRGSRLAQRARARRAGSGLLALGLLAIAVVLPAQASAGQLRGVVLTPNFQSPPPVGVTVAQSDHEVLAACALGSTVARVVMNWAVFEPAPGQINLQYAGRVDRMIA